MFVMMEGISPLPKYWMVDNISLKLSGDYVARQPFVQLNKKKFLVTPEIFEYILQLVNRRLYKIQRWEKNDIWRLSTGKYYSVSQCITQCASAKKAALDLYIATLLNIITENFPKFPETPMITQEDIRKFDRCIDGIHIKIKCPDASSRQDYFNRKQTYSVNSVNTGLRPLTEKNLRRHHA